MSYVKATAIASFVLVLTQVVMSWDVFTPISEQKETAIGFVQAVAWRAIPLGIALFVATFGAIVVFSHRHAH